MSVLGDERSSTDLPAIPWPVFVLASGAVILELAFSGRYGYHRDELYFIACARHLAFGYVDQPPITPLIAGIGNALFHGSLVGFRLIPALALGVIVIVSAAIARELGADRFAQGLAAFAVAISAQYLAGAHLVSPTIFDWLVWTLGLFVACRLLRTGNLRLWAVLGTVAGVGLENKWNVAFLAFGLVVGLLLTPERRLLRSWWVIAGGAIALAIWAPNLAWQAAHGWPQLRVFAALRHDSWHNRVVYWPAQIVYVGAVAPVWVAGLVWLLRNPAARAFRSLAWTYVVVVTLFFILGGKPYYPGGMYGLLLAAGAVPASRYLRDPARRFLKPAVAVGGFVVVSALLLPIALPVLPARTLAIAPLQTINYDLGETIGWPRFVDTVASVYRSLPPGERGNAVILTSNYGEAGAIDRFGGSQDLPTAYSGHNSFWLWGPPPGRSSVTIAVNIYPQKLRALFGDVSRVATSTNGLGVQNDEQGAGIYLCRGQRQPWDEMWPALQDYS